MPTNAPSPARRTRRGFLAAASFATLAWTAGVARAQEPAAKPAGTAATPGVPTIWLIGDSTVKNGTKGQQGWGEVLNTYFDPAKVRVVNRAIGGRSSRTFLEEGRWDAVQSELKPGDYVLMQFGHNDGGGLGRPPYRATIKGNGDETDAFDDPKTGQKHTVHSFGWYLRQYVAGAKSKGATPIVLSYVPRNIWKDGKVGRGVGSYGTYAEEAAKTGGAVFVDLNKIIADRYDAIGQEKVAAHFGETDHTHTNPAGADFNAGCVVAGLRALPGAPFDGLLSPKGAEVKPAH